MKILYVEDNAINVLVMRKFLEREDFHSAPSAETALRMQDLSTFDLFLLDINLGRGLMDGTELMQKLRERDDCKTKPIYAVTAYALPQDEKRFLNAGFDKYFSKPIDSEKLLAAVEALRG